MLLLIVYFVEIKTRTNLYKYVKLKQISNRLIGPEQQKSSNEMPP
ncbi:hypothetical protein HLPCO_002163 [Haloplasma contractile SSD-17B]|uniref:Uncharacterized protein n=1 Tax=Haloplasma contractile SSD-17B TaxID=1033810 RepID=U2E9W8_9MOLU|nr:hypothetical protein HLPCO_002163 [Haloplasma contractile SSD-17B]